MSAASRLSERVRLVECKRSPLAGLGCLSGAEPGHSFPRPASSSGQDGVQGIVLFGSRLVVHENQGRPVAREHAGARRTSNDQGVKAGQVQPIALPGVDVDSPKLVAGLVGAVLAEIGVTGTNDVTVAALEQVPFSPPSGVAVESSMLALDHAAGVQPFQV